MILYVGIEIWDDQKAVRYVGQGQVKVRALIIHELFSSRIYFGEK